jgi:orotidine-5'-phosphate decarboxylase
VFVDLKVPGDIANTVAAVIDVCVDNNVTFLTLSESMPLPAIAAAKAARTARHSDIPKLLIVPFLSSLDASDLPAASGGERDLETYILGKAHAAIDAGCDGVIASGQAIQVCRRAFARPTLIVSPGIRPAGASTDDHKRHTTPAEAIRLGADYLVVGRPILKDPDPREAARRVIAEIDGALNGGETSRDARSVNANTVWLLFSGGFQVGKTCLELVADHRIHIQKDTDQLPDVGGGPVNRATTTLWD